MGHIALLSPDQQPGTRSQQQFETYLYDIPASAVVLKPTVQRNLWHQLTGSTFVITLAIRMGEDKCPY